MIENVERGMPLVRHAPFYIAVISHPERRAIRLGLGSKIAQLLARL